MRENELIARIAQRFSERNDIAVTRGIGDDAAVVACGAGEELAVTTDQVVQGTHFLPGKHPWDALGAKTVVRGLSDLAAMGAQPRWVLLSLGLAADSSDENWEQYITGLFETCTKYRVPLVGGDVANTPVFTATVTAAGALPVGGALLRSGADVGDEIYVSGRLGGSALGLERLRAGQTIDAAIERHWRPQARVELGKWLRESGMVTAAADVSDGLSTDLANMALSSGTRAVVDVAALPRFSGASEDHVLHGGEEYELLFTVAADAVPPTQVAGVELTRIGRMEGGVGVALERDGTRMELRRGGFEHGAMPSGGQGSDDG